MNNRATNLLGVALLLFANASIAGNPRFAIRDVSASSQYYQYDFPLLSDSGRPAKAINDFLWANYLGSLPETHRKNPFVNVFDVPADDDSGTTSIGYQVLRNDSKLFTVDITTEYASASLNDSDTTYTFDAGTGRAIALPDILTTAGMDALGNWLAHNRAQRLEKFIGTLDRKDDPHLYTIYQSCMKMLKSGYPGGDTMVIHASGRVDLTMPRCTLGTGHYYEATDDANIYTNSFNPDKLKAYLNPYGKCLLSSTASHCTPPVESALGVYGVYYGLIGNHYPITFVVTSNDGNDVSANYAYDKYGTTVSLDGSLSKQGKLEVKSDSLDHPSENEIFVLRPSKDGHTLTGTWKKGGKGRPYDVSLKAAWITP